MQSDALPARRADFFLNQYSERGSAVDWNTASPALPLVQLSAKGVLRRGLAVIDIGCGTGNDAVFLAKQGMHVTAIDISDDALRVARNLANLQNAEIDFCAADALSLPFGDAMFDVAIDTLVFHSVKPDYRRMYGQEIARVLKPGGILILTTFSDAMEPGSGPFRLTGNEIAASFMHLFKIEELRKYTAPPAVKITNQIHWLGVFKKSLAESAEQAQPQISQ